MPTVSEVLETSHALLLLHYVVISSSLRSLLGIDWSMRSYSALATPNIFIARKSETLEILSKTLSFRRLYVN